MAVGFIMDQLYIEEGLEVKLPKALGRGLMTPVLGNKFPSIPSSRLSLDGDLVDNC